MWCALVAFLAEETYTYAPHKSRESIFLEDFPQTKTQWENPELAEQMTRLFEIRDEASKLLEGLRKDKTIGKSLEGRLIISAKGKYLEDLNLMKEHLCEFFIVSQVEINENTSKDFEVSAIKAPGEKCPRCWYVSEDLQTEDPKVCPKCLKALK